MSVRNRIRIGFGLPLIVLLVVGAVSYHTAAQVPEAGKWVLHTQEVLTQLRTLTADMTSLVTVQRAALLQGHPQGPESLRLTNVIQDQLTALNRLTSDNARQQTRIAELRSIVRDWNVLVQRATVLRDTQGMSGAVALVGGPEARTLGEKVRVTLRDLDKEESDLLAQRHQQAAESARSAMRVIAIGTGAALLMGILAGIWITRRVTVPVQDLLRAVERIGQGALDCRVPNEGQDEFGRLGATFNGMIDSLQAAQKDLQNKAGILSEERNLLRTLIDHLPEYIFIKDAQCRYLVVNEALRRSQGRTEAESVAGKDDFDLYLPEDACLYRAGDLAVLESGQPIRNYEEPIADSQGHRRWFLTTKIPLKDAQGRTTGLVGICHDVTERREKEAEILTLNESLKKRTHELEMLNGELEAFSYSVSHDLRAPLRHIDGYAELLMKKGGASLDDGCKRYVGIISDSAKQLGRLVDDLLSFSRMGRSQMRATHLSLEQLVGEVKKDLSKDLDGRTVEWKIADLPPVNGDPAMMRQVFVNLLSNALKYSRVRDRSRIEVGASASAEDVIIFVKDNGVGFDMQYAGKLFGVFQRLHKTDEFEGTGIGLANVRRIIQRHGGRTWAESAPDTGATFYFSLPRRLEAA
jgi:PAS domain S-box-containing protein